MSKHTESRNAAAIDRAREKRPTPRRDRVRIVVVLDRSASMQPYEQQVTEYLRDFFALLRGGLIGSECLMTFTQFDATVEICALKQPLDSVPVHYQAAEGNSAVWDAICCTLRQETSRDVPVFCLFVTDGEDNASKEADLRQARAMIQTREEWGNWRFYLLNLQGRPSRNAAQLHVSSIDSTPEKMGEALGVVARRICHDAARLRLSERPLLGGGR